MLPPLPIMSLPDLPPAEPFEAPADVLPSPILYPVEELPPPENSANAAFLSAVITAATTLPTFPYPVEPPPNAA